ncbi:MAG TPA: alpha/beta fold hydrolase [Opitutaceae bacterium]|nr:alpha/beta fold hydrolase [Opitutaceae bacterium]
MQNVNPVPRTRRTAVWLLLLLSVIPHVSDGADVEIPKTARETYTCEKEERYFASWSKLAGTLTEEEIVKRVPDSNIESVQAGDGRVLKGIRIAREKDNKYALLIIQGNAWSSRGFSKAVAPFFIVPKLDLFFFDFRGYGLSKPANGSLAAIVSDYRDIADWLVRKGYTHLYLYTYSFGGVIALNAFPTLAPFKRVVIDAAPARLGDFGFKCDPSYDPADKLPKSCPSLVFMHGTTDGVVRRRGVQSLIDSVRANGGAVDVGQSRGHPFQMEFNSSRKNRVAAIIHHLNLPEDR